MLKSVHLHMLIQALAWGAFLIFCLVRFRQSRQPRASHRGIPPLVPVVAIAAVIVGDAVLLASAALPAWLARATMPAAALAPTEVRVVSEQFAWNIHYPGPDRRFGDTATALITASNPLGIDRNSAGGQDDVGLMNILTVPVGRPVIVHLTSRDVVHAFTLNEMRVRLDVAPGVPVRTWFTPTVTGQWQIGCSQLCGLGHYRMKGGFSVVTQGEWDDWLAREVALIRPAAAQR